MEWTERTVGILGKIRDLNWIIKSGQISVKCELQGGRLEIVRQ